MIAEMAGQQAEAYLQARLEAYAAAYPDLAIGPDNTAYIAYVCNRQGVGAEFISELKVATRRPL